MKEVSIHFVNQAYEREVKPYNIIDALRNPLNIGDVKVDNFGRKSVRFIGKYATVEVNPDTNNLITTWRTGKEVRKKYKGD